MKHIAQLAGLKIDTGKSPRTEGNDSTVTSEDDTTHSTSHFFESPSRIRRSDTNDSLNSLVGRSPSLSNVRDILPLPSPMFQTKLQSFRQRVPSESHCSPERSVSHPSPLSKAMEIEHFDDPEEEHKLPRTSHLLPPNLIDRLNQSNRSQRYASVNMEQPVARKEMPPIVRHRSQTSVTRYSDDSALHREPNLAQAQSSQAPVDGLGIIHSHVEEIFTLQFNNKSSQYLALSELGKGTFSRVILAKRIGSANELVAIKIVALLASGKADKPRIERTARREIDLLQRFEHPLLVKVYGSFLDSDWAYIALEYNPGGDLFSFASEHKALLTPFLIKRIFAEIVTSVRFLHDNNITHRDLKLENILLRLDVFQMTATNSEKMLFTTLTDLGLAREFNPAVPSLSTRCGSEDYAAPEIVMGQAYDGRQTDAWALGALLYCLLEGRLPFDVIPGLEHKMTSKVLHRICRIEWRWVALKEPGTYPEALDGAKRIVTNLLRSRTKRWTLEAVAEDEWLSDEIGVVQRLVQQQMHPAWVSPEK